MLYSVDRGLIPGAGAFSGRTSTAVGGALTLSPENKACSLSATEASSAPLRKKAI